ncbi:MAG: hypothetical protein HY000_11325 [Planctomycetes bacterium]|nr:hypothetical protein [Planctomycetota bacterium]
MSIIDTTLVEVNLEACQRVANWLSRRQIPPDQEEAALTGLTREEIGDFYLFLVAICHQTSPVGIPPLLGKVDGCERRGWDYLLARFEQLVHQDRGFLSRSCWRDLSGAHLVSMFTDPSYGPRLVEAERRAELVRDIAEVMDANNWWHLEDLFRIARGRIASGEPNLVQLLAQFEAYSDPVSKKTFFLLALMRNHRLWSYPDLDQLGAPVDYHEIRGHLRIGTVAVVSNALRDKLLQRIAVSEFEDLAIRKAVFRAIMEISELSGLHDPSRLHYLFWNVFRSCCQRNETHCDGCSPNCSLPDRYVPLALADGVRACPFRSVCEAAHDKEKRHLIEHFVSSDYDYH